MKKMGNLIHKNLFKQIKSRKKQTSEWISNLSVPNDFIALFTWITIKKIKQKDISNKNKKAVLTQFINELKRISQELPNHLASENSSDPFYSYQLHEPKYQDTLAYLLLFILDSTPDDLRNIKNICHGFKPLFYGGFRAIALAKHFSEIMLLIVLSGNRIKGMNGKMIRTLQSFLAILSETVLIPYVHLTEREDEIWNPESEKKIFEFSAGKHLLNSAMINIRKNAVAQHYTDFFNQFENIKIAQWPFERV